MAKKTTKKAAPAKKAAKTYTKAEEAKMIKPLLAAPGICENPFTSGVCENHIYHTGKKTKHPIKGDGK